MRLVRLKADITLAELSKTTGIVISHLSNIETGKKQATIPKAQAIAKALGCTIDDLL